jgi:hypothetical protein
MNEGANPSLEHVIFPLRKFGYHGFFGIPEDVM